MDFMHYIEIAQEYVDEIKAGAGGSSQTEGEEIVGYIGEFGKIVKVIAEMCKEIYEAVRAWMGK